MNRLKILTDVDCYVYIDKQLIGESSRNIIEIFPLHKGDFWVSLVAKSNNKCAWESIVHVDGDKIINYSFANDIDKHPEWINQQSLDVKQSDGCWVLSDRTLGLTIRRIYYDYVGAFYNGLSIVKKDSMYGLIRFDGTSILECSCNHIIRIRQFILYQQNFKYGILDEYGSVICPCEYDDILQLSGRNLLCDLFDTIKYPQDDLKEFDHMYLNHEDYYPQQKLNSIFYLLVKDNKITVINYTGHFVTPLTYQNVKYQEGDVGLTEILLLYRSDGGTDSICSMPIFSHIGKNTYCYKEISGWYRISSNGHMGVIPAFHQNQGIIKYDDFFEIDKYDPSFSKHCYLGISLSGKVGMIAKSGKEMIECKYEKIHTIDYFGGYLFAVRFLGKYALFSDTCEKLTSFYYDRIGGAIKQDSGYTDMISVWKNNKVGVIAIDGKQVIPCAYDDVWIDIYSMCLYLENDKKRGCKWKDVNIPCMYDDVAALWIYDYTDENYSRGVDVWAFRCYIDNKIEVYDATGKLVEWKYDESIGYLSWGLAKVKKNNKYGYINMSFEEIIPCIYDSAEDFINGYAIAEKGDIKYKIDKSGEIIAVFDDFPF